MATLSVCEAWIRRVEFKHCILGKEMAGFLRLWKLLCLVTKLPLELIMDPRLLLSQPGLLQRTMVFISAFESCMQPRGGRAAPQSARGPMQSFWTRSGAFITGLHCSPLRAFGASAASEDSIAYPMSISR